jgi:hypothetical protein
MVSFVNLDMAVDGSVFLGSVMYRHVCVTLNSECLDCFVSREHITFTVD